MVGDLYTIGEGELFIATFLAHIGLRYDAGRHLPFSQPWAGRGVAKYWLDLAYGQLTSASCSTTATLVPPFD
jgi:hypothetical protein